MNIRIGTKVRFLNTTGGGIVKRFEDEMAVVETSDGFDMPVLVTDLIIDGAASYESGEVESEDSGYNEHSVSEKETRKISFEEKKFATFSGEILLALVPENDQILHVSNFELYAINSSNYYLNYSVSLKDSGVSSHILSGNIEPDIKLGFGTYSQTELSKIKEFRLQGVLYKHGLFQTVEPVDMVFNIEKVSFYKGHHFKENDYFHQKALIFSKKEEGGVEEVSIEDDNMEEALKRLKDNNWAEIIKTKEVPEKKERKRVPVNINPEEIDLHIEQLVDSHSELSNGEILNIQLSRFAIALETAKRSKVKKIVFIHGVGNGVLKHELRKKLDKDYPDLKHQDASFKEYGYGATMVFV